MAEYHLSMTGAAPSGESFDVTLYYGSDATWSLEHRISAIGKAAQEVAKAVFLDDPTDVPDGDERAITAAARFYGNQGGAL